MNIVMLLSSIVFLLDRIIKTIVSISLDLEQGIIIIDDFLTIMHVHNYGAAFSILKGSRWLFIILSFIILNVIFIFFINGKKLNNIKIIIYSLLLGGIIGNLIDRILYGYVIDFLDFNIFGHDFAIFNLADTFIVISVILLILVGDKDGIFSRKK